MATSAASAPEAASTAGSAAAPAGITLEPPPTERPAGDPPAAAGDPGAPAPAAVRVAVRVRPLIPREVVEGARIAVRVPQGSSRDVVVGESRRFTVDHALGPGISQAAVFEACVTPLIEALFSGMNATVLAYGQTGSGKTHTMGTWSTDEQAGEDLRGVVPRALGDIFARLAAAGAPDGAETALDAWVASVSMVEVYGEAVHDLLTEDPSEARSLQVRDTRCGVEVTGAEWRAVNSVADALAVLDQGAATRVTGATAMNDRSSRSHAVFTFRLEQRLLLGQGHTEARMAKLTFVDLAGSERQKRTQSSGHRLREGIGINRGLLALGNVISALSAPPGRAAARRPRHVPYRQSNLTRLLRDSLGGNAQTVMIACVSPADNSLEESLSTLRYASRARHIRNRPVVNVDPQATEVSMLRAEVEELRRQLVGAGAGAGAFGTGPGSPLHARRGTAGDDPGTALRSVGVDLRRVLDALGAMSVTELESCARDLRARADEADAAEARAARAARELTEARGALDEARLRVKVAEEAAEEAEVRAAMARLVHEQRVGEGGGEGKEDGADDDAGDGTDDDAGDGADDDAGGGADHSVDDSPVGSLTAGDAGVRAAVDRVARWYSQRLRELLVTVASRRQPRDGDTAAVPGSPGREAPTAGAGTGTTAAAAAAAAAAATAAPAAAASPRTGLEADVEAQAALVQQLRAREEEARNSQRALLSRLQETEAAREETEDACRRLREQLRREEEAAARQGAQNAKEITALREQLHARESALQRLGGRVKELRRLEAATQRAETRLEEAEHALACLRTRHREQHRELLRARAQARRSLGPQSPAPGAHSRSPRDDEPTAKRLREELETAVAQWTSSEQRVRELEEVLRRRTQDLHMLEGMLEERERLRREIRERRASATDPEAARRAAHSPLLTSAEDAPGAGAWEGGSGGGGEGRGRGSMERALDTVLVADINRYFGVEEDEDEEEAGAGAHEGGEAGEGGEGRAGSAAPRVPESPERKPDHRRAWTEMPAPVAPARRHLRDIVLPRRARGAGRHSIGSFGSAGRLSVGRRSERTSTSAHLAQESDEEEAGGAPAVMAPGPDDGTSGSESPDDEEVAQMEEALEELESRIEATQARLELETGRLARLQEQDAAGAPVADEDAQ